jgi:hypothetical protein
MSSQPINYTKIIMIIVIFVGFITGLVLLKNALNKSCSYGEVYDNKLGCIKDCSGLPNTHYDTQTKECVINCLGGENLCGKTCISNNYKCLKNDIPCINETYIDLCGQTCYNTSTQQCFGNKIYDNEKVCNTTDSESPLLCNENQRCSDDKKQCIDCDRILCGKSCCPDGKQCSTTEKCIDCESPKKLCGENCCAKDLECALKDGKLDCCDSDNVYTVGGENACCPEKLSDKGECCSNNEGYKNVDGVCKMQCSDPKIYCDTTQKCINLTVNKIKTSYCGTKGCEWGSITYVPPNIENSEDTNTSVPVFQSGGKYYISKQPSLTLTRSVFDQQDPKSTSDCKPDDCTGRLAERGTTSIEFDKDNKTCTGYFNTDLLPDTKDLKCPYKDGEECCKDFNGYFTGQVCLNGQICHSDTGVCHVKCSDGSYYSNDKNDCLLLNNFKDTVVTQPWIVTDYDATVKYNTRNPTDCGKNGVISRFYMPNDISQKYTYTCSNSKNVDNENVSIKNLDVEPDGSADKYVGMSSNLQCDRSSALSSFIVHGLKYGESPPQASDGTGSDIVANYFAMQCKHIPDLTDCKKMQTPSRIVRHTENGFEGQFGIAGHDVNCNIGNENSDNKYALTGWKYVGDGDFSFHIDYNCCRVNEK